MPTTNHRRQEQRVLLTEQSQHYFVMVIIGIAGGVACGKSLVAEQLKQLGAEILDGDVAGHKVLCEARVKEAVRQRWGDQVFDAEGNIKRPALAKLVFAPAPAGPEQLAHLEQITHPRIKQRLKREIERLAAEGRCTAVVLDAAVMFKAGWDRLCDKIVFVDAPRALRLARARRRGWSEEQFTAREESQTSLDQKRCQANWVVDNSATPDETFAQLKEFWHALDIQSKDD